MRALILLALLLTGCGAAPATRPLLSASPEVLAAAEHLSFVRWELGEDARLWAPAQPSPELVAYRRRLAERVPDLSARALLDAQARQTWLPPEDLANTELARSGRGGRIRPINALEEALLTRQLRRGDMIARPSEFLALVLRKGERLRIYSYTSDEPGVRGLGEIHAQIEADHAAGWQLALNLHNHTFLFAPPKGPLGATVPSATDVWLYRAERKDFGLARAAITNGVDSIEIEAALFERYEALGPR